MLICDYALESKNIICDELFLRHKIENERKETKTSRIRAILVLLYRQDAFVRAC